MEKLASYVSVVPGRLTEPEIMASLPSAWATLALLPVALALLTRHKLCLLETIALAILAVAAFHLGDILLSATVATFALINAARGFERRRGLELQRRSGQRIQQLDDMVEGFLTGLDHRSQAQDLHRDAVSRDVHSRIALDR